MAERKMSDAQREAIRSEIRRGLAQKKETPEILNAVAKKYKITVATARWYLKSISGKASSKSKKAKKKAAPKKGKKKAAPKKRKAKSSRKKSRRKARPKVRSASAGKGKDSGLFALVHKVSEAKLKLALQASKLVPTLMGQLRKAKSLKKLEKKVKSSLKAVTAKAARLKKKIRKLTTG